MRKIKKNIHCNNPAVMFAAGLESLVADPLINPSRCDAQEINEQRKAGTTQRSRGNLFGALLRQFANH